jgi:hypothetical protein
VKLSRFQDPTRWRDRGAETHALESRAAVLADAASQVQPLTPSALSRIEKQVLARRAAGRGLFAFHQRPLRTRLAFAIGLLLLCAATAGGAGLLWRKHADSKRTAAPRAVADVTMGQAPRRSPRVAAPTAEIEAPSPAVEDPAPVRADAPPPVRARRPAPVAVDSPAHETSPPAEAPPAAPHPKVTEGALVAEALFDLRQLHDARAALSTLDRYAREFPHGVLETEALRTRVEAVIQLGDLKAALALLDGKAARADALGDDLALTRAELRAAAGRFREAVADFTQVLDAAAGSLATDGDERALYGRAVCFGRLAQYERARADLVAYQKRFPQGRFAREAARLLAAEPPSSRP